MNNTLGAIPPRSFDPAAIAALQAKTLSMKTDLVTERLAVLFVVNCFRNTVLENYHSDWPKFAQEEMKALMKEAVNKLHTALHAIYTGDKATRDAAWEVLHWQFPTGWDTPEFDQGMLRAIELTKQATKRDAAPMTTPYDIEEHRHRLAAWAASTAASASPVCRFTVEQGVGILEACGLDASFSSPERLPSPVYLDLKHKKWRQAAIKAAVKRKLSFTHGVAAKLINVYLKVRFVCGGHHLDERVKALHPPIDSVLLARLAESNFGGHGEEWRKFAGWRWSKFTFRQYQEVIDLIRESLQGQPLWMIEQHWDGHQ